MAENGMKDQRDKFILGLELLYGFCPVCGFMSNNREL